MESLNLSQEELRTYPRWYTDLLLRKGKQNSVEIDDLTSFLENFGLKEEDRQRLIYLFDPPLTTLDPTAFYIFIRLVSHVMQGEQPEPRLIYTQAPVPQPKSILSTKRKSESASAPGSARSSPTPGNPFRKNNNARPANNAEKPKLDIDSFKTFILTGSMPDKDRDSEDEAGSRPKKRVSFNPDPPQVAEAAARSMEELMRQRQLHSGQQGYLAPQVPQFQQQVDPMEHYDDFNNNNGSNQDDEEEEDVEIDTSAFQNVNIDSVLHHGVSNVPPPEAAFRFHPSNSPSPQPEMQQQQTQAYGPPPTSDTGNKPPPPPPPPPSRRAGTSIGQSPSPIPQSQSLQNLPQFTSTSFPQSPSLNQLSTNNGYPSNGGASFNSLQPQHTNNSMPQLSQLQPQYTNNMQQPLQPQYTNNNSMPQLQPQNTSDSLPTIAPPPPQPRRNRNPPPLPGYTGPNQQMAPPPPPPPPRRKSAHIGIPSSVASSPGMATDAPGFQPLQQPQTTSAPDLLADLRALQEEVDRLRYR